jgi:membrane fusion protein, multidrug efflux system
MNILEEGIMKRIYSPVYRNSNMPGLVFKVMAMMLILCMFAAAGCEKIKMMKVKKMLGKAELEVNIMTIVPKDTPIEFEYIGETESSHMVEIRARVQGFLDQQLYEEGRMVKANQPMFMIDQKPFKANLQAANGQLAQQQARHATALANLKRIRPLAAKNAVSQKDLDDAVGSEQESAAAVIAAEANVTEAELNLSYTVIYSPINGLSSNAKKQTGSYISAGPDSLLTYVARIDPMWINFNISENEYLSMIKETKTKVLIVPKYDNFDVEIVLADGSIYPHEGRLMFADPSFSLETGTFLVRAQVKNPLGLLKPGEFVRVRMKGAIRPNAVTIPRSAVLEGAKGNFVWVIEKENKASVRQINLGQWVGNDVIVNTGLFAGDKIVVEGFQKLSEGQKVDKITEVAASNNNPKSAPPAKTK